MPSPLAPLTPSPPLAGGATSSAETLHRHRVDASTEVRVSVDGAGAPFAVAATQTLLVTVQGDYLFTIGAPVAAVSALPGSEGSPGLRGTSIIWAGFNPGRRTLKARAVLEPAAAAPSLPLRIEVHGGVTTLVNATGTTATTFAADAEPASLQAYLERLRSALAQDGPLPAGAALLTGAPAQVRVRVAAPLLVRGTVGTTRVSGLLTGRLAVRSAGPVHITVTVASPGVGNLAGLSGRELLTRATSVVLTAARVHQYRAFLGNPDPAGRSDTTYVYRTAARPAPPVAALPAQHGHGIGMTLAVVVGVLLAAGAGLVAWSRA